MLTLYGDLESGNVYKVRLLLSHLGIPHRRVDVAQMRGEGSHPAFRAVNPIGKVPTLRFEDGRVLSESGAILFYLARETPFAAADPWDQAQMLRWMFFEQYSHEPYIAVNRYILRYAPEAERAALMSRVPANHQRGCHALSVMNAHLGANRWFAGGRYTIADIALYAYTHTAEEGGFDLAPYPALSDWLRRVGAQPGYLPQEHEDSAAPVEFLDPA
jgi:glutathione S-transferase